MTTKHRLFLLFNHSLTDAQRADAEERFNISEIIPLTDSAKSTWSSIPSDAEKLQPLLHPVWDYLDEVNNNDYVLVQGDFGATFLAVQEIQKKGATAIYATTKRNVVEKKEGDQVIKTSVFEHVAYRIYGE